MTNRLPDWDRPPGGNGQNWRDGIVSAESFHQLHEATHQFVFRYVYGLTAGPTMQAEDITAETYLKAWKSRRHFKPKKGMLFERAVQSWLFQIAKNLVFDHSRRLSRRGDSLDIDNLQLLDRNVLPEQSAIHKNTEERLIELLQTLPQEQCEMIVLRYVLRWSVDEIAELLGKKPNAVYVATHRTLKNLKIAWQNQEETNE